jgi:hypothetical protein
MAPSPLRRRKGSANLRNLLLIGGAVAAAGAVALLKRDKVAGLLPSRSGEPAPPAPAPPQPSNYDAPGPVANTATPIPAPDPQEKPPAAIDEAAEEAAAAAEAAAIGGTVSDYAGPELGERADEAHRPLAEAGEGESEGEEQAEAELADNATYRDAGTSDAERQIDETIEQAGQPQTGETPETVAEPDQGVAAGETEEQQPPATPGGGISGRPFSGQEPPEDEQKPGEDEQKSGEDDWRTWSGRSVDS